MSTTDRRGRAALSPEQRARVREAREQYQAERPGPDALVASGRAEPTVPTAQLLAVRGLIHALREERRRQGLSLTDVSERSGLDRAMISKLENGHTANPTVETLFRYARALGKGVGLALQDASGGVEVR